MVELDILGCNTGLWPTCRKWSSVGFNSVWVHSMILYWLSCQLQRRIEEVQQVVPGVWIMFLFPASCAIIYYGYKIKNMKQQTCSFSSLILPTVYHSDRDRVNIHWIYVCRRRVVNLSWHCKSPQLLLGAPHGSCHTLKGQENRLNMVRLAFLPTKLRGVWARCRWTCECMCLYMSVTASVCLVFSRWCGGERDSLTGHDVSWKSESPPMWPRGLPLCQFLGNVKCFS